MLATKSGVRFNDAILNALQIASEWLGITLTVTSGEDGLHSGPNDPHHDGRAYDVRSYDIANKDAVLTAVMRAFNDGPLAAADGGIVTSRFFGWLENAGLPNEHFHFQWRHGVPSTPVSSPTTNPQQTQS